MRMNVCSVFTQNTQSTNWQNATRDQTESILDGNFSHFAKELKESDENTSKDRESPQSQESSALVGSLQL